MEWSNDLILEFLDYYKNEPVLWNASHPHNKNRSELHDAWKRVETKMDRKYSVSELKRKKESLMASYRTICRKMRRSSISGPGTGATPRPCWFAYEKMASFITNKEETDKTMKSEESLFYGEKENDECADSTPDNFKLECVNVEVNIDEANEEMPSNTNYLSKRYALKKPPMGWSNEMILEFLDLYQNEPIIWNSSHPLNKDRNEVYDAWKRIETKMGGKCSIPDLKRKKDSLMASFRSLCQKIRESSKSGNGIDGLYKPSWFAFEKMASFLTIKDEPSKTQNTEESLSYVENFECVESTEDPPDHCNVVSPRRVDAENPNEEEKVLQSTSESSSKPPTGNKNPSEETVVESRLNGPLIYKILESPLTKRPREKDVCDIYGELVAEKLRRLDENSREIAMLRFDHFLFEMKRNMISPAQNSSCSAFPSLNLSFSSSLDNSATQTINNSKSGVSSEGPQYQCTCKSAKEDT